LDSSSKSEDLIEIAKSEPTKHGYSKFSQIERWLLEIGAKESDKPETDGQLIYWAYVKWCRKNNKKQHKRKGFFVEVRKRFKMFNGSRKKQYYVQLEPFKIDKAEWLKMRQHFRNEKERRKINEKISKAVKKAKKRSKTSRSEETL
jgi:hypothetical protein